MGVFVRPDSPFFWMLLERADQPPIRESTKIPKQGGSAEHTKELRRQAQQVYATRMADLARQRYKLPTALKARTFKQHREWYAVNVTVHKRSRRSEGWMLHSLGQFFDSDPLTAINPARVREWRTWRAESVSAATIRREEAILKHVLSTAIPTYLESHPLHGLRGVRVPETDTRVLNPQEEKRLMAALETPEDKALVVGALDTLLRLSNIAQLTRPQDHRNYLFVADTKTGAIKIPISARLRKALDALPANGHAYFPTYATRLYQVGRMFTRALQAADIQPGRRTGGLSFHNLRHTGASRMLEAGVDVETVAQIGGWKNLRVLRRYLHTSDARKQDAVNLISRQSRGTHKAQRRRRTGRKR